MNYTFQVVIKDGTMTFGRISGDLPDGSYEVGGNEDEHGAGINVTHRLSNGQFVAEAQHYRSHYNYNPDNFAPLDPTKGTVKDALLKAGFSEEQAEQLAQAGMAPKPAHLGVQGWTEDGGLQIPVGPIAAPNIGFLHKDWPKGGMRFQPKTEESPDGSADSSREMIETAGSTLPRRHPQGNVNYVGIPQPDSKSDDTGPDC